MGRSFDMVRQEHQARIDRAWADLLATEAGRFLMFDLMNRTGINASTFSGDAATAAYLEGRRSLGLDLQSVYLAPQGAAVHGKMLIEAEGRAEELAAAVARDEGEGDEYSL